MSSLSNPPLSPWVRVLFLGVALILCVGVGLLAVPSLVVPHWLWTLTPFNARFLGAIYLAELSVLTPFLLYNRQSPGRLVLPTALTFVAIISILSFFYLDRFDLQRLATLLWFIVYIGPTLILTYLLWTYRRLFAAATGNLPHPWPVLMMVEGILLFVYGTGLLIDPDRFGANWPWTLDSFHARMYSAFFFTLAVGAFVVARRAGRLDILTLGIAQVVTGVGVIGGFVVTDLAVRRVEWLAGETWMWIGMFVGIGLIGVLLIGISRQEYWKRGESLRE
jgi:hypothetical protein